MFSILTVFQLIVFQVTSASGQYGHSWMRAVVQSRHDAEHTSSEPRDELKRYINSPLEDVVNVVAWWGVSDCWMVLTAAKSYLQHHAVQYPTLSKMARDYLAIQGSATPSEHVFSSRGATGTAKCNWLKPNVFEALQLLLSLTQCFTMGTSVSPPHW